MNLLRTLGDLFARERDRWILWAPVPLGAGIVAYFRLPFEPPLWALIAAPILALAAWRARYSLILLIPAFVLFLFALGFNAGQIETRLAEAPMLNRHIGPTSVEGRIVFTEVMPNGVRLTLKNPVIRRLPPGETPLKVRVKLERKTLADVPPAGALVDLWAELMPMEGPVMPGGYDFRRQAFFRQLGGVGWSYSPIEIVDPNPPVTSWRDAIGLVFERARLTLSRHVYKYLSGDVAAMTAARLNGEQTGISEPVIEAMRAAGLAHLLSTSGFHVTIMGLLIYFPLRAILALIPWIALRYPIKKWAAAGAILSTLGYTLLVGSQAATLRSMFMTSMAMIAIVADRPALMMRLAILSAVIMMGVAPEAMLGPSFQMSFAAVLCLIAAHEKPGGLLAPPAHLKPPPSAHGWLVTVWTYTVAIVRTSLIATIATTPFAIYHFQTFCFYGFAANTLAIPLTSFWVMPCILLAYITAPFGWDGLFLKGAGAGLGLVIRIALTVSNWPFALLHMPAMPAAALAAMTLGGLWICLWRRRWRWLGLAPILLGALYPFYTVQPDFLVAPDGGTWAARLEDGRFAVPNLRHEKFVIEQWQERLGDPQIVAAADLPP
ncbi:MAG TPA: ComEC/Rec2 family competence protein, partial [Alphaproteobacteria bacterium]|nr:ComEC/Rec2 family competence protein [Alphaproteobacteria bacterium]